ncbi:hypothetical protein D5086_001811 [Populus alba]|uniref:Uncharacterized protein n=1 Tax=Populus alba TaxID=43335 RepID=A0ACC4D204_POPAL
MREKGSPAPSGYNGGFSGCSKSISLVSDLNSKCPGTAPLCRPCPSSGDIASTSSVVPSMLWPGISPSPAGAALVSPVIGVPQTGSSTSSPVNQSSGLKSRNKKRSLEPPTGSASSNPSAEIAAVVQQVPHCVGPYKDLQEDHMTTEAATAEVMRTQSPDRKRSKVVVTAPPRSISHHSAAIDTASTAPPKRQYITRSKAAAIRQSKAPATAFQYHHRPDDPTLLC